MTRYGISVFTDKEHFDGNVDDGEGRVADTLKEAWLTANKLLGDKKAFAVDLLDIEQCEVIATLKIHYPEHLLFYSSDKELTSFGDDRLKVTENGRKQEKWYNCPKCEIGFKKVGSNGSKACPICGYTRTKKRMI